MGTMTVCIDDERVSVKLLAVTKQDNFLQSFCDWALGPNIFGYFLIKWQYDDIMLPLHAVQIRAYKIKDTKAFEQAVSFTRWPGVRQVKVSGVSDAM